MFGFGSRKTRGALAKAELGESLDHFRRAAAHAADGVGATVGPRIDAAMETVAPAATKVRNSAARGMASAMAVIIPLAIAATDGARQAGTVARKARSHDMRATRKKNTRRGGRRWPKLAGLLVAGTAVGAVGAMALRRRGQQQWDEYDPGPALETIRDDASSMMGSALTDPKLSGSESATSGGSAISGGSAAAGAEPVSATAGTAAGGAKAAAKTTSKSGGGLGNATGQARGSRN